MKIFLDLLLTSGFCRRVNEIFALLGCYAVWIGSLVPKTGPIDCPERSVTKHLRNMPEGRRSHCLISTPFAHD